MPTFPPGPCRWPTAQPQVTQHSHLERALNLPWAHKQIESGAHWGTETHRSARWTLPHASPGRYAACRRGSEGPGVALVSRGAAESPRNQGLRVKPQSRSQPRGGRPQRGAGCRPSAGGELNTPRTQRAEPRSQSCGPKEATGRGSRYSCTSRCMNPQGLSPSKTRDQDGAARRGPAPGSPGCSCPLLQGSELPRLGPPRLSTPGPNVLAHLCCLNNPSHPPGPRTHQPRTNGDPSWLRARPPKSSCCISLRFCVACGPPSPCNRDSRQGPGPAPAPRSCSRPWAQPGTEWVPPPPEAVGGREGGQGGMRDGAVSLR